MPWIYHTNISSDSETNNSFNEAFNIFLQQCLIHEDTLRKELIDNKCFRFVIKTDGDNDKIICVDGRIFLKSKFLVNKTFKKRLIDYYRPLGIYVNGPQEFKRRDNVPTHRWMIELTRKF